MVLGCVYLAVARHAAHDVGLGVLPGHGDGGDHVGAEIDAEDEKGGERERDADANVREEGGDL